MHLQCTKSGQTIVTLDQKALTVQKVWRTTGSMCKVWVQIHSDQGKPFDIEILDHLDLSAMFTGVEHSFERRDPSGAPLPRNHASQA